MKARVFVTLKPSVFDPQGRTIVEALHSMGYGGVGDVRQGKYFELDVNAASAEEATTMVSEVADKVLANPVISGGNVQVDFTLISGLPADFKLLHAPNPTGIWNTNTSAVFTTNEPGVSYRFTAPLGGEADFYRVQSR